jgi:putative membrane protein
MSFSNPISNLIISVIIPFFYILLALPFFDILHLKYILPLLASLALFLIADVIILQIVDRYGISKIGVKSTSLLKAFLAVWLEKNSKPIEDHFNKIGKNEQVSIGIIGFKKGGKLKGIIIVPKIHPGPFLNVGSSNLPFIIQRTLEDNYKTVAAIAHGISSHELDLTSTKEVEITVKELLKIITAAQNQLYTTATRLIRVEYGSAKTTCQIFGEAALVTLTLAPKEMDDLPQEIEIEIAKYGKELGLKEVLVIDAHNSILTKFPTLNDEDINNLKISAQQAIAKCVLEPRFEFKLGISKIVPNEFVSVLNIGVAGIVTMIVEVNNQKIAYIVIDGNNMFSGLREDIIRALTKQNIIDDAEILTSDSHIGSAIDLSAIGYHPVGEGIDREKLIHYIEQTVIEATSNMQPVKLFHGSTVFDAKVLGRKNLKELTSLVGYSISKFIISLILIMIPIIVIAIFLFFPSILGLKI